MEATSLTDQSAFYFIEANARLQVEHTVTEEVLGLDLVRIQLELASGKSLADLGLLQPDVPNPARVRDAGSRELERMEANGTTRPAGGTLTAFEVPSGPGFRTDTFGYSGYTTSPRFDSLLAKVIAHTPSPSFPDVVAKTYRALSEFRVEGVTTNISFLQNLLLRPEVREGTVHTRFVEETVADLLSPAAPHPAEARHQRGKAPSRRKSV